MKLTDTPIQFQHETAHMLFPGRVYLLHGSSLRQKLSRRKKESSGVELGEKNRPEMHGKGGVSEPAVCPGVGELHLLSARWHADHGAQWQSEELPLHRPQGQGGENVEFFWKK